MYYQNQGDQILLSDLRDWNGQPLGDVLLKELTPLDFYNFNGDDDYMPFQTVGFAIERWEGLDSWNPLYLKANRSLHHAVMEIYSFINVHLFKFDELDYHVNDDHSITINNVPIGETVIKVVLKSLTPIEYYQMVKASTKDDIVKATIDLVMNCVQSSDIPLVATNRDHHIAFHLINKLLTDFFRVSMPIWKPATIADDNICNDRIDAGLRNLGI